MGHLRLLKQAKKSCDKLIVGVTTDKLVSYKFKQAVIKFEERIEIIRGIKYVDEVIPQDSMNKMEAWKKIKFNIMFVGDDWKNTEKWIEFEEDFKKVGVEIIYFPYTKSTSSTLINSVLLNLRKKF